MTENPETERAQLDGLEAINARAADWMLARQMAETWSAKDENALDAWLSESTSHVAAYWRLDEAWQQARRLRALRPPMRLPLADQRTRAKPRILGAAAVLIVSVLAIGGVWTGKFQQTSFKTYTTPIGGHLHLTLSDGSRIELNTDTTLALSTSANGRFARLERGEAFFDIKHDGRHPFSVTVGDHRVVDIGTKFVVREDRKRIRVALFEGRARFEAKNENHAAQATDLLPGDVVVATGDSMVVSKRPLHELDNGLAWRKGLLIFDNATLGEAANELNRYNTQKIVVRGAGVAQLTIGGTFYDNDVSALLNTARQIFGLKVEKQGNEIVISR